MKTTCLRFTHLCMLATTPISSLWSAHDHHRLDMALGHITFNLGKLVTTLFMAIDCKGYRLKHQFSTFSTNVESHSHASWYTGNLGISNHETTEMLAMAG